MLTISLREFQLNASKYLDKLPLVLTRYNVPLGILRSYSEVYGVTEEIKEEDLKSFPGRVYPSPVEKSIKEKKIKLCEHGSANGLCKHGCK